MINLVLLSTLATATGQTARPAIVQIAGVRLGYTPLCAASLLAGMSLWFVWSALVHVARHPRPGLRGLKSGPRK